MSNLTVFIDCLPYSSCKNNPLLKGFSEIRPVKPGFGYSCNIKVELFAGLKAIDYGYFNEFQLRNHFPTEKYFSVLRLFGKITQRQYYIDRILHKILSKYLHRRVGNIPLELIPCFEAPKLKLPYDLGFHVPTILDRAQIIRILHTDFLGPEKDKSVIEKAYKSIHSFPNSNFFLALSDLDSFGHNYYGTEKYDEYLNQLLKKLLDLLKYFNAITLMELFPFFLIMVWHKLKKMCF